MNCDILPLAGLDVTELAFIRRRLTHPGSDFHKKLKIGDLPGHIAVVWDNDEIVGWARTEPWTDGDGWEWNTLEAFVDEGHRRRGIAAFAACGLACDELLPGATGVAVFHPPMYVVAARAGLKPTLFVKGEAWVRA